MARGRLTLDHVSINQTGAATGEIDISAGGPSASNLTYRTGMYGSKFTLFTVADTSTTATNGAGISLSQMSEYIRLTDSTISTIGSSSSSAGISLAVQNNAGQLIDRLYLDNVGITTSGNSAPALYAFYSKGTIGNSTLNTSGTGAHGIDFEINGGSST